VTFGAFVEILDGVEGLVHISELAPHHVENPREIVTPGDDVKVKILEIDSERRRLSLSVKRVEDQILPSVARAQAAGTATDPAGDLDDVPELGLSDDVFAEGSAAAPEAPEIEETAEVAEEAPEAEAAVEEAPEAEAEAAVEEAPEAEAEDAPEQPDESAEPVAESDDEEPTA
jgi:small subunit ribosomal protein S1